MPWMRRDYGSARRTPTAEWGQSSRGQSRARRTSGVRPGHARPKSRLGIRAAHGQCPRVPRADQAPDRGDAAAPSFEEAIQKLEAIVESMESGELPLESLLQRFEEGSRLLRSCHERLADAELKIQRLEKDLSGNVVARPFEDDAQGTDTGTT